jgi:hypothetical protein
MTFTKRPPNDSKVSASSQRATAFTTAPPLEVKSRQWFPPSSAAQFASPARYVPSSCTAPSVSTGATPGRSQISPAPAITVAPTARFQAAASTTANDGLTPVSALNPFSVAWTIEVRVVYLVRSTW